MMRMKTRFGGTAPGLPELPPPARCPGRWEATLLERRGFLSGLATLPLIGGGVCLIGSPTAAAVPVSRDLLHSYASWLHFERRMVCSELAGHDSRLRRELERGVGGSDTKSPGDQWHFQWATPGTRGPAGWIDAPQPSTRAAVVLSAVGCPLVGDTA